MARQNDKHIFWSREHEMLHILFMLIRQSRMGIRVNPKRKWQAKREGHDVAEVINKRKENNNAAADDDDCSNYRHQCDGNGRVAMEQSTPLSLSS